MKNQLKSMRNLKIVPGTWSSDHGCVSTGMKTAKCNWTDIDG
jgi:hypothetical protein